MNNTTQEETTQQPDQEHGSNKRERLLYVREQLENVVPRKESALALESRKLEGELRNLLQNHVAEIAELWNGQDTVTGRLVQYDRANWKLVLKCTDWNYVLLSVEYLQKCNSDAAQFWADAFAQNKIPRAISPRGTLEISTGSFKHSYTAMLPCEQPKVEPKPAPKLIGNQATRPDGTISKW